MDSKSIAIGVIAVLLATSICEAQDRIEYTRAAQRLVDTALNFKSREDLAKAIYGYCAETSKHLPSNTPQEEAQLYAEIQSKDLERITRAAKTVVSARSLIQKSFKDCAQISNSILGRQFKTPKAEAVLWLKLEGSFDSDLEYPATLIGIYHRDSEGNVVSDLHAITMMLLVRTAIRSGVLLPLLQSD